MRTLQKIFQYQGKQLRTVILDDQPWWVAKDVCEILDISKYRDTVSRLDDDERGSVVVDTLGGPQQMAAINEPGLYSLIMTSRKPEAREFKRWIIHNVLPSIRQTGSYIDVSHLSPELQALNHMVQLATKLELEQRQLNQNLLDTKQQVNVIKNTIIHHNGREWRKETVKKLRGIGLKYGKYDEYAKESYRLLEERAGCKLNTRLDNLRQRMAIEGATRTAIKKANYLDVIELDKRLKEIYISIVNQMYVKYAA